MAYGITSRSQLIDIQSIKQGCNQLEDALNDFEKSGDLVIESGNLCNKDALSLDEKSMEYSLTELGEAIKALKGEYQAYTQEVENQANRVYSEQCEELQRYIESQQQNTSN